MPASIEGDCWCQRELPVIRQTRLRSSSLAQGIPASRSGGLGQSAPAAKTRAHASVTPAITLSICSMPTVYAPVILFCLCRRYQSAGQWSVAKKGAQAWGENRRLKTVASAGFDGRRWYQLIILRPVGILLQITVVWLLEENKNGLKWTSKRD